MFVSTVRVRNFRNLEDCRLDLQPGLNVLVGRNNVGKSNLIDAIRHAFGPAASAGDLPALQRSDFREDGSGVPVPIEVSVTFSKLTEEERATFFEVLVPDLDALERSEARLMFEATWTVRNRPQTRRWGGPPSADGTTVPNAILEALPITFLPALRDAEAALTPGYKNRLAQLLQTLASESDVEEILEVFGKANDLLEGQRLIKSTVGDVQSSARRMSGSDYRPPSVRAAEPDITRVLRSLRLTVDGPVQELGGSGLGYQNILYIATVLSHLKKAAAGDCPLLLVEEPEAHLHPQLVVLLGDSLASHEPGHSAPQTLVTTHSPTFAAHVEPGQIRLMTADDQGCGRVRSVGGLGLTKPEARAIQRMMDVTRSALYFAKGAILVEGISEALLVPVLARRLGRPLEAAHVSVLPLCGVAFSTLAKLLDPEGLGIPVAIISDADPGLEYEEGEGSGWRTALPKRADGAILECPRVTQLRETFANNPCVEVFISRVTLEHELAAAGDENAAIMAAVWETLFDGTPATLTRAMVEETPTKAERALVVWRGICLSRTSGSKADFAHRLADVLEDAAFDDEHRRVASGGRETEVDDQPHGSGRIDGTAFVVPDYIEKALGFVLGRLSASSPQGLADDTEPDRVSLKGSADG